MEKENRAPASSKASSSSTTTGRVRKPVKQAVRTSSKKAASASGDEEEDEDELMLDDGGDAHSAEDEEGETVLVAETQFDAMDDADEQPGTSARQVRGGNRKGAAGKKAPAVKKATTTVKKGKSAAADVHDEAVRGWEGTAAASDEPSPREKKLEKQLEATKKALADMQVAHAKLRDLRTTRSEEAELRLQEIANERQQAAVNTIAAYKAENDALRSEVLSLQETAFASPRSKAARLESLRVQELETKNAQLTERVHEIERTVEQEQERAERDAAEQESNWKRETAKRVKEATEAMTNELKELRTEVSMARTELAAEVAHSKSLQQKLKANPSSSLASTTTAPTASSASSAALAKLQDENERLTSHLNLNEDLTGFAVHSVKHDDDGATYTCVLSDCAGTTGSLNFKLNFHADGTVGYQPDVDRERDAALAAVLPAELQNYMRFQAELSAEFFKRLFAAVNKVKI